MTTTERGSAPGKRRRARRRPLRALAALLAVSAGGAAWFHWQCWGLQVTHTGVRLGGLPKAFDSMRVVQISDLHGHEYGEGNRALLEQVRRQAPALIVVTGDLIDQEGQLGMVPALAKGLSSIAATYYVTGNHEWSLGAGTVKELKGVLARCGVTVLSNQYEILEREGARIVLAGVDDPNGYADQATPEELYARIQDRAPGLFTLLLAHRNDRFGQYAAAGYDFVMSGHAHGGIVRLPFAGGLVGASLKLFPKWTAGVCTLGGSTLFVSRGMGNNTAPFQGFRVFNRPELAVVTLEAG